MKMTLMILIIMAVIVLFFMIKKPCIYCNGIAQNKPVTQPEDPVVGLIIAHEGYKDTEYNTVKDLLQKNNFTVVTISDQAGTAKGIDGGSAKIDKILQDVSAQDVDALYLIGGPNTLDWLYYDGSGQYTKKDNFDAIKNLFTAVKNAGKPYGAICVAPIILAKAGLLTGKNATGSNWAPLKKVFKDQGATYVENQAVVIDGNVITATGPSAAADFGNAIVDMLRKKYC